MDPASGSGEYEAALFESVEIYLARGWKLFVIPAPIDGRKVSSANCNACDTAPPGHDMDACTCLLCHGFHAATDDRARLAQMFGRNRGGSLAVRTGAASGITVIDVDTKIIADVGESGEHTGMDTLDQWESWVDGWSLPATLRARTRSGGLHLFYTTGSDDSITSRAHVLPGIDVKSRDGYVVLPPEPGSPRAWLSASHGSTSLVQPPSADLLRWLQTAPGRRVSGGSWNGSSSGEGALNLDVLGKGGPSDGQDEYISRWIFRLYQIEGLTSERALVDRVYSEVRTWPLADPRWPWTEEIILGKVQKVMRKFAPPDPVPSWQPAVLGRDGVLTGGAFTSGDNVVQVDFGGAGGSPSGGSGSGGQGGAGGPGGPGPDEGGGDVGRSEEPPRYDGVRVHTLDDVGNAHRFVELFTGSLAYVDLSSDVGQKSDPGGFWIYWNGIRWERIGLRRVRNLAYGVADHIEAESARTGDQDVRDRLNAHARGSRSARALTAMIELASGDDRITVNFDRLDTDPELLVVRNGVLDLKTGEFRDGRPTDMCTLSAAVAYDPAATCPRWEAHVHTVAGGDPEMAAYLRRMAGYSLTGLTGEHAFFSLEGTGANGKNAFIEPLMYLMGDYATVASSKLLTQGDRSHASIIADLANKRLVFVDEVPQGKRLESERVKSLVGSGRIKAQHMRQDWFEFTPVLKLWIAGNDQPRFNDASDGIWRRMHRVVFKAKIPEGKRILDYAKLLFDEEGPGILNWCLAGLADWRANRLGAPASVTESTAELRADSDHVLVFMDECFEVTGNVNDPDVGGYQGDWVGNDALFQTYEAWCKANGIAKADILEGPALGRRVSRSVVDDTTVKKYNDRRDGVKKRGFEGVRLTQTGLSIFSSALG